MDRPGTKQGILRRVETHRRQMRQMQVLCHVKTEGLYKAVADVVKVKEADAEDHNNTSEATAVDGATSPKEIQTLTSRDWQRIGPTVCQKVT